MGSKCCRGVFVFCVLSFVLGQPLAWAQAPSPAGRAASDPAIDAARAAYEALPDADRRAIQDNLIWTGDYSGIANGTFGRQTFDALVAYQQRSKLPTTGILSAPARAALQAAAQQARTTAGFSVIDDPKSGVRIGVPSQVLSKQDVNPNGGSRWQSADGKITLDTRVAPPDATLQALFDRNVAIQTPGRAVTYKIIRPDFFVIAGETPTGKFYTRYASAAAGIRAFSIGYDKTLAAKIDPIVVAIANSFTPFPTGPMPIAAAPTPAMPAAGKPPSPITASNVLGTGLAVAKRQIVTGADVGTCKDPRAGGVKPLRIGGTGPWLWDFADDLKAPSARLASRDMMEGSQLLVVGFSVESAPARLDATPGVAIDGTAISAPLQPGASGAPVFDQSGAFVGLVGTVAADGRRIAGIMPTTRYALVAPEKVNAVAANIIGRQSISAAPMRAAEIVNATKPSLVPIQCGP